MTPKAVAGLLDPLTGLFWSDLGVPFGPAQPNRPKSPLAPPFFLGWLIDLKDFSGGNQ
jgi:hypothetical protein